MTSRTDTHSPELVINWHMTEVCNYRCGYCYAKWQEGGPIRELFHDPAAMKRLIAEISTFFAPTNAMNPLAENMRWDRLRFNLAGGEPLLYAEEALQAIRLARQLGSRASIITNGSKLTPVIMTALAPLIDTLGLSLDAVNPTYNLAIGRVDRANKLLVGEQLAKVIAMARDLNPALSLKINTVVNAINWNDDMGTLIASLSPEKWKILRMLPQVTDHLAVSDTQFAAFVQRHAETGLPMRVEDNSDMTESYIMIDPHGRFFQNAVGSKGYRYSDPIQKVGIARAFSQVQVSADKFNARYAPQALGQCS